jgi:HEAT repeat protein
LAKSPESDARTLAADVLAVRMVMAHVLGRICQLDPILAEAIQSGFEDAVDQIRKTATKSPKRLTSHQAVEVLAAVKTLRAAMSNSSDNHARPSVANDNK